jgi:2-isopropylmalate synthase
VLDDPSVDLVFMEFKRLADKKKDIYDADLEALVVHGQMLALGGRAWELESLSTTSGTGTLPCASIALRSHEGERFQEVAAGDGPVDAVYRAIEKVTGIVVKLRNYEIASVSTGEDAQGEVTIEVEHPTGVYRGRALSTDIIEGSARAFLDVVNRIALKMAPRVSEARAEMGTP